MPNEKFHLLETVKIPPLLVALVGYMGGSQHGHLLAAMLKVLIALGAEV